MLISNKYKSYYVILILGLMSVASHVQAAMTSVSFGCITNNVQGDCIIGENQFSMNVVENAANSNKVFFNFYNNGADASSINGVYFDDGTLVGIANVINTNGTVSFSGGSATLSELPGNTMVTPNFITTQDFLADANGTSAEGLGVDPNQYLGIEFSLLNNQTYSDVISSLASGALRVGIHALSFASSATSTESFVNIPLTAVPVPPAFILFGSAILLLFGRMRNWGNRLSSLIS